ncbi:MAG: 2-phospho-L-lactate guanylyltransferase [Anaerolineales bacterium]|nr:2-phospho-L-lactate guanylyltransferase [Anaerolineales bacterium]
MRRLIVVMAKQPAPGRTKTRLSPPLSAEEAAELYRCFLLDKFAQMGRVEVAEPAVAQPAVAYWPPPGRDYFANLAPDFELLPQAGENLSERLIGVFAESFARGYHQVMALDGDTPTLPARYLRRGLERLADPATDVVLGPCEDGGYYAIGLKHNHPSLFDVQMSTPHVTADTLAQAEKASLRVELLPTWYDVDTPADRERSEVDLKTDPTTAPATSQFLQTNHPTTQPPNHLTTQPPNHPTTQPPNPNCSLRQPLLPDR